MDKMSEIIGNILDEMEVKIEFHLKNKDVDREFIMKEIEKASEYIFKTLEEFTPIKNRSSRKLTKTKLMGFN